MGDTSIKAHCNQCGGLRNHLVLHEVNDFESDEEWWCDYKFMLIRCAGCENVHMRQDTQMAGHLDDESNHKITTVYYPPAVSRRRPEWMSGNISQVIWTYESQIGQLLNEIYAALQNDSRRLAVMGIRAVLEIVMIEKIGGDTGNFGRNIERFFELGFVALHQQALFRSALIEAGHAAMHRGYKPTEAHLSALLDMTEALIAAIYIHPARVAEISNSIPSRQIPNKS